MKFAEKMKDTFLMILAIPFVFISSIVIRLSGADHDTWPSLDEMKGGGDNGRDSLRRDGKLHPVKPP